MHPGAGWVGPSGWSPASAARGRRRLSLLRRRGEGRQWESEPSLWPCLCQPGAVAPRTCTRWPGPAGHSYLPAGAAKGSSNPHPLNVLGTPKKQVSLTASPRGLGVSKDRAAVILRGSGLKTGGVPAMYGTVCIGALGLLGVPQPDGPKVSNTKD
jgi:hypothetical protein